VKAVTIPYNPGYSDAVRVWAAYVFKRHLRPLVWFAILVVLELLIVAVGARTWLGWVTTGGLVLTALVGLVPLAFRLLWAYKIRHLGIHQLDVVDGSIVIHGKGLRLESPLAGYDGLIETHRYFILTRRNGLFSFVPKQALSTDAVDRIRCGLQAGIRSSQTESPGAKEVAT
jgi:hypothetical protein